MGATTEISWTDHTWSPWEGCTNVSPGCERCYAEALNKRFRGGKNWGPGAPRRLTVDWDKPRRWNATASGIGRNMRVFPSICDPFDNEVAFAWRSRFFDLIESTSHLTWLLLTKRVGNVVPLTLECRPSLPPNVWLGATIVDQEEADRDLPKLLKVPAAKRFVSYEPALGPMDLRPWLARSGNPGPDGTFSDRTGVCGRLHQVIAGGESGPGARPADPAWFRSLRDQCAAAGTAFFMKQMGGERDARSNLLSLPEDLRIREFPL